jgi:hypothetical protein
VAYRIESVKSLLTLGHADFCENQDMFKGVRDHDVRDRSMVRRLKVVCQSDLRIVTDGQRQSALYERFNGFNMRGILTCV